MGDAIVPVDRCRYWGKSRHDLIRPCYWPVATVRHSTTDV